MQAISLTDLPHDVLSAKDLEFFSHLAREWQGYAAAGLDRPTPRARLAVEPGIIAWGNRFKVRVWVTARGPGDRGWFAITRIRKGCYRSRGYWRIVGFAGTVMEARRLRRRALAKLARLAAARRAGACAPAAAAPPLEWRAVAGDPGRLYLFAGGVQVGGWCARARCWRDYDAAGGIWGPRKLAPPIDLPRGPTGPPQSAA